MKLDGVNSPVILFNFMLWWLTTANHITRHSFFRLKASDMEKVTLLDRPISKSQLWCNVTIEKEALHMLSELNFIDLQFLQVSYPLTRAQSTINHKIQLVNKMWYFITESQMKSWNHRGKCQYWTFYVVIFHYTHYIIPHSTIFIVYCGTIITSIKLLKQKNRTLQTSGNMYS